MLFKYRARTSEEWEARANQSGSDRASFIRPEYKTYRVPAGELSIRILPPSPAWENAPHYGIEAWVHYEVGPTRGSALCLFRMKGEACIICEEKIRAERAKDEDLANNLRVAKRVLAFVINRKDESQGGLVFPMAYTLDAAIAKAAKDRSTGQYYPIDSPTEGYDIFFDREGTGKATRYTGVALAKRPTPVADQWLEWLRDKPLPEVLHWPTYEEVKRLYEGVGRGEAPGEEPSREPPRRAGERRPSLSSGSRSNGAERSERRTTREELDDEIPEHPRQRAAAVAATTRPQPAVSEPEPTVTDAEYEDVPPFEPDPPKEIAAAPADAGGQTRAEELRAKFLSRITS